MSRIALITTSYPDATPGSEAAGSFVEDFAIALSRHITVSVAAAAHEEGISVNEQLEVRRFAVPRLPLSLLQPYVPRDWPAIAASISAGRRALSQLIDEQRPDHILALWALPCGWWAQSTGIPFSIWALGSDIWSLGRVPLIRGILKNVLRNAEHRFADGFGLCAEAERLCGEACSFLPSARNLPKAQQPKDPSRSPFKLAFLGRWHPNKGADLLIEALALLENDDWKRISEVRFFGGGPLENVIRPAAATLVAAGRPITVGGYLDKQGAANLFGWADFVLLPSRIESIPVIFSDAMQMGTPLIATPVGDMPILQKRYECGFIAESPTSASFAAAIRMAIRDSAPDFSAGVRRARREFDVATIAAQFLDEIRIRK